MEGLLLAEAVRPLEGQLPVERAAWRFPDERTAVVPLLTGEPGTPQALWIFSRPPSPRLALRPDVPPAGPARTPFQEQLAARAAGPLTSARQQGLDRVVELRFGATGGFVPQPPVTLVAELTGRNANLVLVDANGTILGVERPVRADRNRYRELRPGIAYRPPPPYRKLDPRAASPDELRTALRGLRVRDVRGALDGIGAELTHALAQGCRLDPATVLEGIELERVVAAMPAMCANPAEWLARAGGSPGLAEQRSRHNRERAQHALREASRRRVSLAERRLRDAERAMVRADEAARMRHEADLLMAYASRVPAGADRVSLPDFDGAPRELRLDPRLDAFANATRQYDRARRLERRAERAREERTRLKRERLEAQEELDGIDRLPDRELLQRAAELYEQGRQQRRASGPGIRFRDPHGFEVVVGRSARENDEVTFRVARSKDLWLHVQGFTGAHVVVRAEAREVPFETVLFAARLAAGFSPARQSDNVAVDYTARKNVWKAKGQPPGAVRFSHHKTVYVTPARDAAGAAGRPPTSKRDRGGGEPI